jgi:serine/threonine protein kinase
VKLTINFSLKVESIILACKSQSGWVVRCFGITKDPKTNNFMMVMRLLDGSLRQYLNDGSNSINWAKKIDILDCISIGLRDIHNSGLIHRDFHCGNILSNRKYAYITDLGLCQPANAEPSQDSHKNIYGVLPYVAPEVLRGKEYTQASDIYGFGIIAYEICTGFPPYHDVAHDEFLAMKICQGLRPKSNYKIPQLILDVIERCWDADPSNRPKADDLYRLSRDLYNRCNDIRSVIYEQIKEADEINEKSSSIVQSTSFTSTLSYVTHPQAVYTSRLLNFKNLPEPKNADNNGIEYSGKYL